MFFIPAVCCLATVLYTVGSGKSSSGFWKKPLILLGCEYAALIVLHLLLRRFMAGYTEGLPVLPVLIVCLLPYIRFVLQPTQQTERIRRLLKKLCIACTAVFLLEIFLFNGKSLCTEYSFRLYQPDQITYSGGVEQVGGSLEIDGNATLLLDDIPENARCLTLPLVQKEDENALPYYVRMDMRDDNFPQTGQCVQQKKMIGKQTECRLSFQPYGKPRELKIDIYNVSLPVTLKWIKAANCLPFAFHTVRFWILLAVTALILMIVEFSWYRIRYDRKKPAHLICVAAVIALCMGLCGAFVRPDGKPYDYIDTPTINDPYALVFDAFEKGQTWLDLEADPALKDIEHVYSKDERDNSEVSSHWDYVYYEGHYYCYFGVMPVLFYYYPYYWIHGQLPALSMAVNFFAVLSVLFFSLALLAAVRMFRAHPNLILLLLLIPTAALCSGAYYMMDLAGKYQLPMVAGLSMLSLCLLTGIKACMAKRMPVRMVLLFVSGASLALCAGARPSMALGAAVLCPLYLGILLQKHQKPAARLGQAACFLVPLCAGAAGLMYYNQIRFGSPLDFGAAYQLTVSDVHANHFRLSHFWSMIHHYFTIPTRNRNTFPFFEPQFGYLDNYQQYVYCETTVGWLNFPLILLGMLCQYPALAGDRIRCSRHITRLERRSFVLIGLLGALLISWMDFSAGGINQRYLFDVAPLLLLCSVIAILCVCRKPEQHRYVYLLFCGAITATAVFAMLLLLEIPDGNLMRHCPELYNQVEEMAVFWQ